MSEVYVITGAATGLGRVISEKLAGTFTNRLVLVDNNRDAGLETLSLVKNHGVDALFVQADVTKEEDVKNYVELAIKEFGQIDYFINNAGVLPPMRLLHEYSEKEYNFVTDVNLKGAFLGLKYVITEMLKTDGGVIINTVSSSSFKPAAFNGLYAATKHALAGLTKSVGQDYQEHNIYAVGVAPNTMNTAFAAKPVTSLSSERLEFIGRTTPPNQSATPEEITEAVLFALNSAKILNGTIINCSGGQIFN